MQSWLEIHGSFSLALPFFSRSSYKKVIRRLLMVSKRRMLRSYLMQCTVYNCYVIILLYNCINICIYVLYIYSTFVHMHVNNHTSEKMCSYFAASLFYWKYALQYSMRMCRLISGILLCIILHHDVYLGHFKFFKLEGWCQLLPHFMHFNT